MMKNFKIEYNRIIKIKKGDLLREFVIGWLYGGAFFCLLSLLTNNN